MTITLKIKNNVGPYTATLKRMTRHTGPFHEERPHQETKLGELAPGEEMEATFWNESYMVIEEKKMALPTSAPDSKPGKS